MSKTKTPFFSMEAHGSVGGAITAQKRNLETLVREKPLPTDPYSLPQAYQRWLYEDYAYLWTKQTPAIQAQYRTAGVRFHLTGFQYWMKVCLSTLPYIVGMWHLDELAGALAHDYSKMANNGTIFGTSIIDGVIDHARLFDGLNDEIQTLTNGLPTGAAARTIEAFIYPTDSANIRAIYGSGTAADYTDFFINRRAARDLTLAYGLNGYTTNVATITLNKWQHVAVTFSGTNPPNISLDGVSKPVVYWTGTPPVMNTIYGISAIGSSSQTAHYWKGYIDHVIVWTIVLDSIMLKSHAERRYPLL